MGMSASQVRFLSLQSRKNDVSRQLMSLSNRKMSLSRDMNKVSQHYTEALNQKLLKWSNDSGASYNQLTYDLMMKPNDYNFETPYIVSTRDGRVVVDSTENLIGRVVGADGSLSDYQEVPGLSYAYFANKITTAAQQDGTTGSIYTTTEGLTAGTANKGVYVVPKNVLEYGFENSLRYEIFQELGLVTADTTTGYTELLNEKFGTEEAYKYGNYNDLLKAYLLNGINQSNRNTHLTINGTDYGEFGTNFGYIDPTTNTWAVKTDGKVEGCLMGNLALAELAITEYDQWINELKTFNLTSDTSFSFTATSGRSKSWTVQPFLNMNNNVDGITGINSEGVDGRADDDGGIANDFQRTITNTADDGTVYTIFDSSWLNNHSDNSADITNQSWLNIYNNGNSAVKLQSPVSKWGLVSGFIDGLQTSMNQASTQYAGNNGTGWTFVKPDTNNPDMVDLGDGTMGTVQEAAKLYATNRTVAYYGSLEEYNNNYGGCGSCHGEGHFYNKAADAGASATDNVLGRSNSGRCFWHSITHFLGGLVQTIGGGLWTAITSVISAGGLFDGFIHMDTGLVTDGWDNFSDSWQGDGARYTLNMANVEKTYLTYYEMYMQAYQDGYNLLLGEGTNGSSTSEAVTNTSVMESQLCDIYSSAVLDAHTTNADGSITYTATGIRANATVNGDTGAITYDKSYYTFSGGTMSVKQTGTQTITLEDGSTVTEPVYETVVEFNSPKTADSVDADGNTSTVQYNKMVQNSDGSVHYYLNGSEVNITRKVVHMSDSYGALKIAERDSHFTSTLTAYLTPDAAFKEQLKKDRQDALDALDDWNDRAENFFSGKETKLMDYYDAIFLRIAESGWVNDNKVNGNNGATYLNNKLMNNDYFVTECKQKADETGYNYTNKMATSVMKIYEVNDDSAQNQALAKYESDKTLISNKEAKIDAMMQKLETEQEAINTEMESVQKIVSENIDKTFKIFA